MDCDLKVENPHMKPQDVECYPLKADGLMVFYLPTVANPKDVVATLGRERRQKTYRRVLTSCVDPYSRLPFSPPQTAVRRIYTPATQHQETSITERETPHQNTHFFDRVITLAFPLLL